MPAYGSERLVAIVMAAGLRTWPRLHYGMLAAGLVISAALSPWGWVAARAQGAASAGLARQSFVAAAVRLAGPAVVTIDT